MTTRRLSSRENIIFMVCLLMVMIYVGYHFFYRFLKNQNALLADKMMVSEKRLKNHLKMLQKEPAISKEFDRYIPFFKQTMSDDQQMTSVISEIEASANDLEMRVTDMKPKKVKRIDFYNNFSVSLTVEGDLTPVIHFLYGLQNTPHFFNVDEAYFARSAVRTTLIRCRLVLSKALIPEL